MDLSAYLKRPWCQAWNSPIDRMVVRDNLSLWTSKFVHIIISTYSKPLQFTQFTNENILSSGLSIAHRTYLQAASRGAWRTEDPKHPWPTHQAMAAHSTCGYTMAIPWSASTLAEDPEDPWWERMEEWPLGVYHEIPSDILKNDETCIYVYHW